MPIEENCSNQPRYLTVNEWCKEKSWPPVGGLRHLIFHAETNGFDKVIRRCGRRILLNEQEFIRFIETNNNVQPTAKHEIKKTA